MARAIAKDVPVSVAVAVAVAVEIAAAALATLCLATPVWAAGATERVTASLPCPPAGETRASLQAMKAADWRLAGDDAPARGQTLALALVGCLADADPTLRDELAFEALSAWMRARQLAVPTLQTLRERLLPVLAGPADAAGFAQPFAALVLSELARADRLQPFLSATERADLVEHAARYLAGVRDYRGFSAQDGWRHGVAHGADLALQLVLHPRLERQHGDALLAAIAAQVMPAGTHAYRFGEGTRLMTPVYYLARNALWQEADWSLWFDALLARLGPATPATEASLAQRHNLGAFVAPLYAAVQEHGDEQSRARLLPGLRKALRALR